MDESALYADTADKCHGDCVPINATVNSGAVPIALA